MDIVDISREYRLLLLNPFSLLFHFHLSEIIYAQLCIIWRLRSFIYNFSVFIIVIHFLLNRLIIDNIIISICKIKVVQTLSEVLSFLLTKYI